MDATLEAVKREGRKKNEANRLRATGKIPQSSTDRGKDGKAPESIALAVDPKPCCASALRFGREHVDQPQAGRQRTAGHGQESTSSIPSPIICSTPTSISSRWTRAIVGERADRLKGEPKGVKLQGGVLDFVTRDIEVECLPTDIPEHIDIDVTELMLHDSVRVRAT